MKFKMVPGKRSSTFHMQVSSDVMIPDFMLTSVNAEHWLGCEMEEKKKVNGYSSLKATEVWERLFLSPFLLLHFSL